ncbi:MAG: hypothetical protein ACOXZ9_10770 [Bacteroidales bacterium]|jgi:hypothetical protein
MTTLEIILTALVGILTSGVIYQAATFKQRVKQAVINTEKSNLELAANSVTTVVTSVNSLMEQNKDLVEQLDVKNRRIRAMEEERENLVKRIGLLEKRVNRMSKLNKDVIILLEKIGVDTDILDKLKNEDKCNEEEPC